MPIAAATSAVIEFVGIIVLSNQLGIDGHLRAMLPRIQTYETAMKDRRVSKSESAQKAVKAMSSTKVEDHTAFIAFKACDYVSSKGWTVTAAENMPGYLYARLDGEQVQFLGSAQTVDRLGRRISGQSAALFLNQSLSLPHVTPCCKDPKLRPEYLPPDYLLAAAVFDIANGKVRSCDSTGGRADSQISIANDGTLLVSATKDGATKELRLNGTAQVMVANLPPDALAGAPSMNHDMVAHKVAYSALVDVDSCLRTDCVETRRVACGGQPPPDRTGFQTNVNVWREGVPQPGTEPAVRQIDIMGTIRYDEQCSNNQWP